MLLYHLSLFSSYKFTIKNHRVRSMICILLLPTKIEIFVLKVPLLKVEFLLISL